MMVLILGAASAGPDILTAAVQAFYALKDADELFFSFDEPPATGAREALQSMGAQELDDWPDVGAMWQDCAIAFISGNTPRWLADARRSKKPVWEIYSDQPHTWPRGWVAPTDGERGSTVTPSMDFEVYSEAGFVLDEESGKVRSPSPSGKDRGLGLVGTPVYAEHPSTDPQCLFYNLKDGHPIECWIPGLTGDPVRLFEWLASGGMVEAFNITFEWWIWNMVCTRRLGWPPLPLEQCVCVMARARRFSWPGSLAKAAEVAGLEQKDKAGKDLIRKLCVPCSKSKKFPHWRKTPSTHPELFAAHYNYCRQDVVSEDSVASKLPDMSDYERQAWLTDQRINARGVAVDVETLDAAIDVKDAMFKRYSVEFVELTGGAVGSPSEIQKFLDWLKTKGQHLPDLTKDTVAEAVERLEESGDSPVALRALQIRQTLGSANIKKLDTLKLQLNSDGRLRNQYLFCGADRTGRFSSGGVQLQNLTSKGPAVVQCEHCGQFMRADVDVCGFCGSDRIDRSVEWSVDAAVQAVPDIRARDLNYITDRWGAPEKLLAGCLRALFVPAKGKKFICCDFSAIEAVGLAAMTRCQWRLEVFRTHGRIYEMSASKISGVPFEEMLQHKKDTGHDHPLRKSLGKVAELASGYAGWVGAWKAFGAEKHFKDDNEIKKAILGWREASPEIVEFWGGQYRETAPHSWEFYPELYGVEGAAIAAVQNPGQWFRVNDFSYGYFNDILFCRLPSGRFLHYYQPRLIEDMDRRAKAPNWSLTFMGWNSNPKFGPKGWTRLETYGGKLTENLDQGTCADIQWCALMRLESRGFPVVMHTHDEAICEVPGDFGSVPEMEGIMAERESWFSWWPIKAAGWEGARYRKD